MAWTKFVAPPKQTAGTGVTAALRKGKNTPAKMNFTIRADVCDGFGWAEGDKLEAMIGEGEHHGLIRFRKNNSVGTVDVCKRSAAGGSHFFTLTLGHLPSYIDRNETKRWINAEAVEEGWVEFVLPSWADETSPRRTAPPQQKTVAANGMSKAIADAATFQRPRRDVTPGIMGDPPANRSALAEKQRA